MRRVYTLFILVYLTISGIAQTQQGYVKTLERPNQKGSALSGVTVRVKGGHSAVLSRNDGTFSMQIQGNSYVLQQVQKTGYDLNDAGVIGRVQAYSANVPLTVVMVSKEQLQTEKKRIEDKAYQVAGKNYKSKVSMLEKQLSENAITIESYRAQIQDLQDKFEKYQSLIDVLADHYAHVDYCDLNEKEREINLCIENGDLERADQLLQQLGIQQRIADIESRLAAGQSLMDEANADMAAIFKQQEKEAEHLYRLYTIALAKFDNMTAKQHIETRAALDTTNIEYSSDAGHFLRQYLSDYTGALHYYNQALRNAKRKTDQDPSSVIQCLMNLGLLYAVQFDYYKSGDFYSEAGQMARQIYGDNHPVTEKCLQASVSSLNRKYEDKEIKKYVIDFYKQSLSNLIKYYQNDINHSEIADCYNSMGVLYNNMKQYDKAIEAHTKALNIRNNLNGVERDKVVVSYHNIAMIYINKREWNKALAYLEHSLQERIRYYGENHDMVATEYIAKGQVHCYRKEFDKASESFNNALKILVLIHGNTNPKIAHCYSEIGMMHSDQKEYEQALNYYNKSLNINTKLYGDNHLQVGLDKNNIGFAYINMHQYMNGVNELKKAKVILSNYLPYDSPILVEIRSITGFK